MKIKNNVSISGTHVMTLNSKIVNRKYSIYVALPETYSIKKQKKYPVVYLLDANYYFAMTTEITRMMALNNKFPETIIVGIGYPVDIFSKNGSKTIFSLRANDLSPVIDKQFENTYEKWKIKNHIKTGGAYKFLQFIKSELVPIIKKRYRIDENRRIIAGHSIGGLFSLYALFNKPQLFDGYIAGSPSIWFGRRYILKYEEKYANKHNELPFKIHLSVGALEKNDKDSSMINDTMQLYKNLKNRKYKGINITMNIIDNCDHTATPAQSFQVGLMEILKN